MYPPRHPTPPALPPGALGFIAARHDRPERLALYRPDGTLSNTYAVDATARDVADRCGLQIAPLTASTQRGAPFAVWYNGAPTPAAMLAWWSAENGFDLGSDAARLAYARAADGGAA